MSHGDRSGRVSVIETLLQHDFFVYDGGLNFRWSPSGVDVLQRLRDSRTFLVDNNVSWKALAQSNRDVNFVIGCTVAEEANDLQGVLFSRMPAGGYPNAFSAELTAVDGVRIVFNRLDERFQAAVFARPIPTLQDTPAEHRANQLLAAASLRFQLQANLSRSDEDIRRNLAAHVAHSRNSYSDAAMAAMLGTVVMLQGISASRRRAKLDPNYLQLPGDTRLLAEALFYGFPILSNDLRDVHTLGEIVGVAVISETRFRDQSGGNPTNEVPAT